VALVFAGLVFAESVDFEPPGALAVPADALGLAAWDFVSEAAAPWLRWDDVLGVDDGAREGVLGGGDGARYGVTGAGRGGGGGGGV